MPDQFLRQDSDRLHADVNSRRIDSQTVLFGKSAGWAPCFAANLPKHLTTKSMLTFEPSSRRKQRFNWDWNTTFNPLADPRSDKLDLSRFTGERVRLFAAFYEPLQRCLTAGVTGRLPESDDRSRRHQLWNSALGVVPPSRRSRPSADDWPVRITWAVRPERKKNHSTLLEQEASATLLLVR